MDYAVLTDLIYLWLQIKLANIFIKKAIAHTYTLVHVNTYTQSYDGRVKPLNPGIQKFV